MVSNPGLHKNLLILALFLFIGSIVYTNSIHSPFQFDDDIVIVENPNIKDIKNLPLFFIDPHLSINQPNLSGYHYRPLVTSSYALNYFIGGLNPAGFHIVNIAIHIGTAFLIFLILQALLVSSEQLAVNKQKSENKSANYLAALAAGLIFLVHPFNSEAVNYATARSSLMSGFFYLLGFWCWVRYRQVAGSSKQAAEEPATRFYIASILAFIAGMLSKEVVVTLPVALWLYDMYGFAERGDSKKGSLSPVLNKMFSLRTYLPYLPFILMVIIPYLIIRLLTLRQVLSPFKRDIVSQLLTEAPALVKHWQMFLIPKGLSLFHDVNIYKGMTFPVLISIILSLSFIAIAVYLFMINNVYLRIISFFMLWFFIVLMPTIILPLNMIFQENRGYLALISFTAIAGVLLSEVYKRAGKTLAIVVLVLLAGVYSVATIQRNYVWQDDVRLWKNSVENAPLSPVAYAGLAAAYRDRGDLFLSIEAAKKGVAIDPDEHHLHMNLGRSYQLAGDTDMAIREYEEALRIDPGQAIIWNELAALYTKKGDLELTENYLKKAIRLWKDLPPLHYNLGVVLAGRGKLAEAEEEYNKAVSMYPAYIRARFELGELFEKTKRNKEAGLQYSEIIKYGSGESFSDTLAYGQDKGTMEKIISMARMRLEQGKGKW